MLPSVIKYEYTSLKLLTEIRIYILTTPNWTSETNSNCQNKTAPVKRRNIFCPIRRTKNPTPKQNKTFQVIWDEFQHKTMSLKRRIWDEFQLCHFQNLQKSLVKNPLSILLIFIFSVLAFVEWLKSKRWTHAISDLRNEWYQNGI